MKELIKEALATKDMQVYENIITLMGEQCDICMNGANKLELMKQMKSEIGECHYDSRMARLHLGLIKRSNTSEEADIFWSGSEHVDINLFDWYVLWGEMVRRNEKKIRKWFPSIGREEFCKKICDECNAFLDVGGRPFFSFGI